MQESAPMSMRTPTAAQVTLKALMDAKEQNEITIRPAADLRDEREARKNQSRTASINRSLKAVVAEINTAHQAQKSEVYSLNVIPEVAEMLREAGYKVQPSSAVRSGDLDSTHISW